MPGAHLHIFYNIIFRELNSDNSTTTNHLVPEEDDSSRFSPERSEILTQLIKIVWISTWIIYADSVWILRVKCIDSMWNQHTNPTFQDSDNQFTDIKYSIRRRDIDEKMEKKKENSEISSEATSKKYMDMTTNEIGVIGDKKEYLFKILVIGELGTGKTSIIKRYVHQFFSQHYRATIGVDFALKVLNWDSQTIIRLQLWDIAGQERFGSMTRVYYKEAVGAFIVFDVTRSATLDAVIKWKQDLDSKLQLIDGSPIPCVLLANKCDQQKEGLVNSITKMNEYCEDKGFAGWFETSAKNNINIEEAANFLVNQRFYLLHFWLSRQALHSFSLSFKVAPGRIKFNMTPMDEIAFHFRPNNNRGVYFHGTRRTRGVGLTTKEETPF
ncbi:unnamed protein product [Trichogramma brassicae]|uniref:Ras-related protein Rab n=1 Tax=Trichogramma brassicae TaxID=86971 RepID=A0A6H5I361_9HYME|nr:unnamed protein product [Trichogramma brassicae]